MVKLNKNEETALQVYEMVKDMRGDFHSSDPEEIAEFAGMCLNTVIHLGGLVSRLLSPANDKDGGAA